MNLRSVRSNLAEAREQLDEIIAAADTESLDEAQFQVWLEHVYLHLNFAWNTRRSPDDRVIASAERDFKRWRKYPRGTDWDSLT